MMKKMLFFALFLAFWGTVSVSSQVRIGGTGAPEKGTVLDLKSSYAGGLLLPNVDITNVEQIPAGFSEVSVQNQEENAALTGMIVYNIHSGNEGIFIWDGKKWNQISTCTVPAVPTITYSTGHPVIVPADFLTSPAGTLTATLNSAGALGYELSSTITPLYGSPAGGLTASLSGSTVSFTGSQYGAYEIQFRAMSMGTCTPSAFKTDTVYVGCGALVGANTWKAYMCWNLGADYTADPFTPSYEINGAYYQWGKINPAAAAPATDGTDSAPITWDPTISTDFFGNGTNASDVSAKSAQDPCPSNWRVPNANELYNLRYLNKTVTVTGALSSGLDNWSVRTYNSALPMPNAGSRAYETGSLGSRGTNGFYWSNANVNDYDATHVTLSATGLLYTATKTHGFSIRCIIQ